MSDMYVPYPTFPSSFGIGYVSGQRLFTYRVRNFDSLTQHSIGSYCVGFDGVLCIPLGNSRNLEVVEDKHITRSKAIEHSYTRLLRFENRLYLCSPYFIIDFATGKPMMMCIGESVAIPCRSSYFQGTIVEFNHLHFLSAVLYSPAIQSSNYFRQVVYTANKQLCQYNSDIMISRGNKRNKIIYSENISIWLKGIKRGSELSSNRIIRNQDNLVITDLNGFTITPFNSYRTYDEQRLLQS